MTMICVRRMLSGVRKFSQRILVEATGADWLIATPLAGCRRAPAARTSQTPATKTSSIKKYGRYCRASEKLNPGREGIGVLYNASGQRRNLPVNQRVVH